MRVNERRLGLAAGAIAALSYTLCALLVAVAPTATMSTFGFVLHLRIADLALEIGWASYVVGVGVFSVITAAHAWGIGWMYNRLAPTPVEPGRTLAQVS